MDVFNQTLQEAERATQTAVQLAIFLWILTIVFAIGVAIWMFKDAEARGKNGPAAGLLSLLTIFYGIPVTLMVLCGWILFRPDQVRRVQWGAKEDEPVEFPSGVAAAPNTKDFLGELEGDKGS